MSNFPPEVAEQIGFYVYRLEDPRDDKTFYVGKGIGNRAFRHARNALDSPEETDKLGQLRSILRAGLEPRVIIHRHGLDEDVALQIEAALIDAYGVEDLANEQKGHASSQGMMTAEEIIELYGAEEADIREPAMLIKIERQWDRNLTPEQLYERTRRYWIARPQKRRPPPQLAMAVARGIIRGVYEIDEWEEYPDMSQVELDPTRKKSDKPPKKQRRIGFIGRIASDKQNYVGRSIRGYEQAGSQNPISYINC